MPVVFQYVDRGVVGLPERIDDNTPYGLLIICLIIHLERSSDVFCSTSIPETTEL